MDKVIEEGIKLVATTGITQLIKTSVDTYIKPKMEKYLSDKKAEKVYSQFEENIIRYLKENYEKNLIMNTIVFQNEQKTINDLYIPLTLVKNDLKNEKNKEEYIIDSYREDLISKYKKILLVDSAGMGKSTVIKYLYLASITQNKAIPILIELRKLDANTSIIEYILDQMNGIDYSFTREDIIKLIENGDFVFFLDGYDEIKQESRSSVTENLQRFIFKSGKNMYLMASREESALRTFGDFQRFDIKSLMQNEAYDLIKRYDSDGELSKELIDKLENEENLKVIREFMENPLMVSLLYKAFEYKKIIPYKKDIFYKQVYNALYDEHDLSKSGAFKREKKSGLDIKDFHTILRILGFITLKSGIVYSEDELYKLIDIAKSKTIGLEFKSSDFLYDITHSVPIFIKDGLELKWVHKSFQEYFAANYIYMDSRDKQSIILKSMNKGEKLDKYYNVLDFYYDIDYRGFMRNVLYPIIDEMDKFSKGKFSESGYKEYDQRLIDFRRSVDYIYRNVYFYVYTEEEKKIIKQRKNHTYAYNLLKSKLQKNGKKFNTHIYDGSYAFAYTKLQITPILRLLSSKDSDLVQCMRDFYDLYECLQLDLKAYEAGRVYLFDDKINNILNEKSSFKQFAYKLTNLSIGSKGTVFNYNKCMKFKKIIEKEIEEEKNDIYLL